MPRVLKRASGTVDVLYAGSFLDLMEQHLGPAFHKATGYTVSGYSAGSTALANEISGRTVVGDVFISASPSANDSLEGASNGNRVTSYEEFGLSPLVLGYYGKSKFARDLLTKPWFQRGGPAGILARPHRPCDRSQRRARRGCLGGHRDDPRHPGTQRPRHVSVERLPETALVGDLQAGQLDAGFFDGVEAAAAHLKTVPLKGTTCPAQYTVAILNRAPHQAAAKAFVRFLLSSTGRSILNKYGVTPIVDPPLVTKASSVASTTTTTLATTTTTS